MDNATEKNKKLELEIELLNLKNKLLNTLVSILCNNNPNELSYFYRKLELLKQKYDDPNDFNFVECIKSNLQDCNNYLTNSISNISPYIYNYNNEYLLKELLNNINTNVTN